MKILLVDSHYPAGPGGGSYTFFLEIVRTLKSKNTVFVGHFGQTSSDTFEDIPVVELCPVATGKLSLFAPPFVRSLLSLGVLVSSICQLKIDVLFPQGPSSSFLCGLGSKITGIPSISFAHGLASIESKFQGKSRIRACLNLLYQKIGLSLSTCILVASGYMKNEIGKMTRRPIIVVPLGVNLPTPLSREAGQEEGIGILYFGRLAPEKGVDILIRALLELSDLPVKLTIVGTGPWSAKLQSLAYELGVSDKVSFKGFLAWNEVESEMCVHDVAVIPSRYEPFGLVALEMMAHGLPVLASNTNGLREIIREGIDGVFFEPEDYVELANVIRSLVLSPEKIVRIRSNVLSRAREFSWQRTMSEVERVFLRFTKK